MTTTDNPKPHDPALDRAQWTRFNKTRSDRCLICGHRAAVTVELQATEFPAKAGSRKGNLASERILFCHEHGIMRFADALNKLNGTTAR